MPFPEDRGWKDTVWVDGQVELLVYYGQPSWPHFPFLFHSQTLEMMDRGSVGRPTEPLSIISSVWLWNRNGKCGQEGWP